MYDDGPVVRQSAKRTQRVWGRLGNILRREGLDIKVVVVFYSLVVRAVLLFRSYYWVLLEAIDKTV